jgi:hypothetical protein
VAVQWLAQKLLQVGNINEMHQMLSSILEVLLGL